jgi:hypothetical protein
MSLVYGQIEQALAATFEADSKARQNSIRSRLKHLRRLGIPLEAKNVGRGQRRFYDRAQALQMLLALEAEEFGLDPAVTAAVLRRWWDPYLASFCRMAVDAQALAGNPVFLGLRPKQMSAAWDAPGDPFKAIPQIQYFRPYTIKRGRPPESNFSVIGEWLSEDPPRVCLIPLTVRIQKFEEALVQAGALPVQFQQRGATRAP